MIRFTSHARIRLEERLSLSNEEINDLLENSKCVLLGQEEERVHKLFYSKPDNNYFVAIHDETTNEMVTILSLDYHNRWVIDLDMCAEAKNLVLGITPDETLVNTKVGPQQKIRLILNLRGYHNRKARSIGVAFPFSQDWLSVIRETIRYKNADEITRRLKEIGGYLKEFEEIEEIHFRVGKKRKSRRIF